MYSDSFARYFDPDNARYSLATDSPDYYLKLRGPDSENEICSNGVYLRHYHLMISMNPISQPIESEQYVILFNGEIYNNNTSFVDGANIVPALHESPEYFTNLLDGEFAIIVYDKINNILQLATDPFGSKPLFFGINKFGVVAASYSSAISSLGLKPKRVAANTIITISLADLAILKISHPHRWLITPAASSLDDWCIAFENSMRKRIDSTEQIPYFGLSGGYDSGVISCFLSKQIESKSLPVLVLNEIEQGVQIQRASKFKDMIILNWSALSEEEAIRYAETKIEHLRCIEYSNGSGYYSDKPMIKDSGFKKLIAVASAGDSKGRKVFLDGMGGDEIYSDYGWNGRPLGIHSNFGGRFPDDILSIVPSNPYDKSARWASFYNSTMSTYLAKSEHVIGSFGHESRYPLLDKSLVKCFLNLPAAIKNSKYKAPLDYYLSLHNWPVLRGVKHGF